MDEQNFLERMASLSRQRAAAIADDRIRAQLRQRVVVQALHKVNLSAAGFDIMAEVKRRSPARGVLAEGDAEAVGRARAYVAGGAFSISVLTEPAEFGGSLSDLEMVASAVDCPVMRKDFLVDPVQLLEARAYGASGALLIVRMLSSDVIDAMVDAACELGLFLVFEIFGTEDVGELERALSLCERSGVVAFSGINCRDLTTLDVDAGRHAELFSCVPSDRPIIAESGVGSADDAARLAGLGYRAALVGTSLMMAADPRTTLAGYLKAGRVAAFRESPA